MLLHFRVRRAPKSTLFPYTTLFRSSKRSPPRNSPTPSESRSARRRAALPTRESGSRGNQDRKSTRLNSSHSQTSYAVFCLKKKIEDLRFTFTRSSLRDARATIVVSD